MMKQFLLKTLVLWFVSVSLVWASTEADLINLVQTNSDQLVVRFKGEKELYYKDPERFYQLMDDSLQGLVDFRRIAARVMGKYGRQASKEQREQFVDSFKKSLFNAYAKALVESGEFKVSVMGAALNSRDDQRANVDLEVTASNGNKYPISYSMYQNKDDNQWYIENVIVSGINLGLAFRDRFEQEMSNRHGDLAQVIANWSSKLEEDKIKPEAP